MKIYFTKIIVAVYKNIITEIKKYLVQLYSYNFFFLMIQKVKKKFIHL